jgi:uncharacterized protein YjeT (DUF2065 family)
MPIIIVKLIGIYIAIMGAIFLFRPKALKPYAAFWEERKRLYIIGGSRLFMGLILLLAASSCRLKTVVVILGILIILAGLPYFFMKLERLKNMAKRWENRPALLVRILGLLILAIGALLLYSA